MSRRHELLGGRTGMVGHQARGGTRGQGSRQTLAFARKGPRTDDISILTAQGSRRQHSPAKTPNPAPLSPCIIDTSPIDIPPLIANQMNTLSLPAFVVLENKETTDDISGDSDLCPRSDIGR